MSFHGGSFNNFQGPTFSAPAATGIGTLDTTTGSSSKKTSSSTDALIAAGGLFITEALFGRGERKANERLANEQAELVELQAEGIRLQNLRIQADTKAAREARLPSAISLPSHEGFGETVEIAGTQVNQSTLVFIGAALIGFVLLKAL